MKAQQVASGPRVQREPGECPHQARQVPADNKCGGRQQPGHCGPGVNCGVGVAPGQGGVTGGQCGGDHHGGWQPQH